MSQVPEPNESNEDLAIDDHGSDDVTDRAADHPPGDHPPGDHPLLEARNVSVRFETQHVLSNINLSIRRGQTVAVIGESGCGKSVFMKTLIGLVRPTSGFILLDGINLADMNHQELVMARRRFGFVFQNAALFDSMTVFDNVAFPLRQLANISDEEVDERVFQHLAEVGLPKSVGWKRPAELSGGMRKRVGLARALILKPEVIVYDEPTTGLDPIMSDVINELIMETRRRYPVTSVVVTHDMRTARKVADRVLMFYPRMRLTDEESQILFDGSPSELENAEDRRVRQFVRGEAGERLNELAQQAAS